MAFFTTTSKTLGSATFNIEGAKGSSCNTLYMMVVVLPVNGFSPVRN